MRMELTSFWDLIFNPVAQAKFVHTVGAGYVTGSMFVVAISAYYLLSGRFQAFAKRSIIVASAFGLAAALCVVVLGDESGYTVSENQKMKLAAIEGMWKTEPAPAGFNLIGIPDPDRAARSTTPSIFPGCSASSQRAPSTSEVAGIDELVAKSAERIRTGLIAYDALERLKAGPQRRQGGGAASRPRGRSRLRAAAQALCRRPAHRRRGDHREGGRRHGADGRHRCSGVSASWSGSASISSALFAVCFLGRVASQLLAPMAAALALWSLPLPWIAAELGWIVAEYGRQPWAIDGVLPTFLAVSSVSAAQVLFTPVRASSCSIRRCSSSTSC